MRLKTLSSDWTIFRRDLTRFAPLWLGLCAWLAIWASSLISQGQGSPAGYGSYYEPIAPFFAPVAAIVLFGYLCDPVECNMVHSLPLRRERLFAIHTLAALVMFLVPVSVFCFVTRDVSVAGVGYRLLFTALEFLFLFSIGVLCMMLTGRKIGAALLYIFIQALGSIVYILVEELFLPGLPGVFLGYGYAFVSPTLLVSEYASFMTKANLGMTDWAFVAFILVIALSILSICLVLYRRRKLEHAGDLLAVRRLDPFFAFCSGMTGAAAMYVFTYEVELPAYLLGAAVGYLAYWMLSKKTARVFQLKIIGGLACLLAGIVGSIYLVSLDPLDRVFYVPEPEQVVEMVLSDEMYSSTDFETSDPAVIAQIEKLHLDMAEHHIAIGGDDLPSYKGAHVMLTYKLENGRIIRRKYAIEDEGLIDRAEWYLSQPVAQFGLAEPEFAYAQVRYDHEYVKFHPDRTEELIELVLTSCREGKMFTFGDESKWRIEMQISHIGQTFYVSVPADAAEVIAWLEANCTK